MSKEKGTFYSCERLERTFSGGAENNVSVLIFIDIDQGTRLQC
jgi:hypothetical protein